jgi:hypothetical protein
VQLDRSVAATSPCVVVRHGSVWFRGFSIAWHWSQLPRVWQRAQFSVLATVTSFIASCDAGPWRWVQRAAWLAGFAATDQTAWQLWQSAGAARVLWQLTQAFMASAGPGFGSSAVSVP